MGITFEKSISSTSIYLLSSTGDSFCSSIGNGNYSNWIPFTWYPGDLGSGDPRLRKDIKSSSFFNSFAFLLEFIEWAFDYRWLCKFEVGFVDKEGLTPTPVVTTDGRISLLNLVKIDGRRPRRISPIGNDCFGVANFEDLGKKPSLAKFPTFSFGLWVLSLSLDSIDEFTLIEFSKAAASPLLLPEFRSWVLGDWFTEFPAVNPKVAKFTSFI